MKHPAYIHPADLPPRIRFDLLLFLLLILDRTQPSLLVCLCVLLAWCVHAGYVLMLRAQATYIDILDYWRDR